MANGTFGICSSILHSAIRIPHLNGALDGTCTHTLPADNGLLFYSATRAKWWEVLVTLQYVSSDTYLKTPDLQSGGRNTSQNKIRNGSGSGSRTHLNEFMRLISVLW